MTVFSVTRHATEIAQLLGETAVQEPAISDESDAEIEATTDIQYASDIEAKARERIADLILGSRRFTPREFEWFIAALLTAMGFKIVRQPQPGADGGVDIIVAPDVLGFRQPRIIVQVKHRTGSVGLDVVQRLAGTLQGGEKGLLVSTGGFATGVERQAGPNITLLNERKSWITSSSTMRTCRRVYGQGAVKESLFACAAGRDCELTHAIRLSLRRLGRHL